MENGSGNLSVTVASLRQTEFRVSARVALTQEESGWVAQAMVLDAFPEFPNRGWTMRDYGRVRFLNGEVTGKEGAGWISSGSGQMHGVVFGCTLNEYQNWTRHPSNANYGPDAVAWPYTRYELRFKNQTQFNQASVGFMLSDVARFFPDYQTAVASCLYDSDRSAASDIVAIRIAHTAAWISGMHLSPTAIAVNVAGADRVGVKVHLVGSGIEPLIETVDDGGIVRLAVPNGIPESGYVVLGRGNRWLDYRQLNRSITDSTATADAPDLATQYDQMRYRGEGEQLEFKEQMPLDKERDKVLKTVAAFANGKGGVILFGIEDGTGVLKGLTCDPAKESDRITNMIRTVVVPQPEFRILHTLVDNKLVMSLTIEPGDSPPYGTHPDRPEYFVRRGATTFPARQDEVRSLAQPPATSEYGAIPVLGGRLRRYTGVA